ncbi:MAG: dienelactone hydrolase family protein [Rhodospirillaceae bacterium]|nr:dienelactone hydrolase family protein [Rhodospirillaceae bacterium]
MKFAAIFATVLLWTAAAAAADIAGKDIKLPATEREVRVTYFHAPGEAKRPAALLLHGAGGFDRRLKEYFAYASTLANAGIDAYLVYYYSAADEAGYDFELRYPAWARLMDDLADHLRTQPQSNGKVGLVGFSNGGILASGAAALDPNITAAVIYYGTPPWPLRTPVRRYPPLLILHGDADTVISVNAGRQLAKDAEAIGAKVDLVIYPGETHGFGSNITGKNGKDALDRTVAFLRRELAVSPP